MRTQNGGTQVVLWSEICLYYCRGSGTAVLQYSHIKKVLGANNPLALHLQYDLSHSLGNNNIGFK